jgi:hypothetical protein
MTNNIGKIKLSNNFKNKLEGMLGGKLGIKQPKKEIKKPKLIVKKRRTSLVIDDNENKAEEINIIDKPIIFNEDKSNKDIRKPIENTNIDTNNNKNVEKNADKNTGIVGNKKIILNIQNVMKTQNPDINNNINNENIKYFIFGMSFTLNLMLILQCFLK